MKHTIAIAFFVGMSAALVGAGEEKPDLEQMQGTWLVDSLTEEGKAVPSAETEVLEVTIEKDVFTVKEKGKAVVRYQFKLDPSKKPKEVDFTYLGGDDKGKTEPGIYAIEKGQLKFVLDEKKKGRPTTFEGKETATYSVMVLKRKEVKEVSAKD